MIPIQNSNVNYSAGLEAAKNLIEYSERARKEDRENQVMADELRTMFHLPPSATTKEIVDEVRKLIELKAFIYGGSMCSYDIKG